MTNQKREINVAVIHCSDSDYPQHDNIETVRHWHKIREFSDVGYHYYIRQDGTVEFGRDLDREGAHVLHYNHDSVGICLGGKTYFSEAQMRSAARLLDILAVTVSGKGKDTWIFPHNYFTENKTCPNFNLEKIAKHSIQPNSCFYLE